MESGPSCGAAVDSAGVGKTAAAARRASNGNAPGRSAEASVEETVGSFRGTSAVEEGEEGLRTTGSPPIAATARISAQPGERNMQHKEAQQSPRAFRTAGEFR